MAAPMPRPLPETPTTATLAGSSSGCNDARSASWWRRSELRRNPPSKSSRRCTWAAWSCVRASSAKPRSRYVRRLLAFRSSTSLTSSSMPAVLADRATASSNRVARPARWSAWATATHASARATSPLPRGMRSQRPMPTTSPSGELASSARSSSLSAFAIAVASSSTASSDQPETAVRSSVGSCASIAASAGRSVACTARMLAGEPSCNSTSMVAVVASATGGLVVMRSAPESWTPQWRGWWIAQLRAGPTALTRSIASATSWPTPSTSSDANGSASIRVRSSYSPRND